MSKFELTYDSRYSLSTYEDVIKTYEWLRLCFEYVFNDIKDLKLTSQISFSENQIDYECTSIEEFREYAFGHDIKPGELFLNARDGDSFYMHSLAYFWTRNNSDNIFRIILSTDEKKYLVALKEALDMGTSIPRLVSKHEDKSEPSLHVVESKQSISVSNERKKDMENKSKKTTTTFFSQLFWELIIKIIVMVAAAFLIWKFKIG